jgi:AraC family transcriptional regulator
MSLTIETLHTSSAVRVQVARCRPRDGACGPDEEVRSHLVALPLRGLFVKHRGGRDRVVGDACHALFFNPGEPYRVSHPVEGGDDCLVVEPRGDTLADVWGAVDGRDDPSKPGFARTHAILDAQEIAARRLFWHRLGQRLAGGLEADEVALELLARVLRATSHRAPRARWSHTRSHHEDMVQATMITLAQGPAESWTLGALARRVHSSPFHLARIFRQRAGMPLHRYHLLARMAAALDEVLDSSRDFTTIALDLGFSSHSHFTATFRRTFGVTPSTLRRQATGAQVTQLSKILTARRPPDR